MSMGWICRGGCEPGRRLVITEPVHVCPWCGAELAGPIDRDEAEDVLREANEKYGTEGGE